MSIRIDKRDGNGPVPIGEALGTVLKIAAPQVDQQQRRIRLAQERLFSREKMGPRYHPTLVSLEAYEVYNESQKAALAMVRRIREGMADFIRQGRPILFYGSWGTGKDHLLANLLYAACHVTQAIDWFSCAEIHGAMRDAIGNKRAERNTLRPLLGPDVIGISDPIPHSGKITEWQANTLYRVLDRRYRDLKCTWMTVNARDEANARQLLTPPIYERLIHDAVVIPCFWPSKRKPEGK